jgi:hypothetical protein
MIEHLITKYSKGKIIINKEEEIPLYEVTKDIVSIMNIYIYSKNKWSKKI